MIIRNAELTTSYLSHPLRIASAQGILSPTQIAWTNASIARQELDTQGKLSIRRCVGPCNLGRAEDSLGGRNPEGWDKYEVVSLAFLMIIAALRRRGRDRLSESGTAVAICRAGQDPERRCPRRLSATVVAPTARGRVLCTRAVRKTC